MISLINNVHTDLRVFDHRYNSTYVCVPMPLMLSLLYSILLSTLLRAYTLNMELLDISASFKFCFATMSAKRMGCTQ